MQRYENVGHPPIFSPPPEFCPPLSAEAGDGQKPPQDECHLKKRIVAKKTYFCGKIWKRRLT
jgi:hypothetical protein